MNDKPADELSAEMIQELQESYREAIVPGVGALAAFLDKMVDVESISITQGTIGELKKEFSQSCLKLEVVNTHNPDEWVVLLVKKDAIDIILSVLLGETGGDKEEFSDMQLGILEESLSQVITPLCSSIQKQVEEKIEFSEPKIQMLVKGLMTTDITGGAEDIIFTITSNVKSEDGLTFFIYSLMPLTLTKKIINTKTGDESMADVDDKLDEPTVQPLDFPTIEDSENVTTVGEKSNIDLIKEVPLEISVELGKTTLPIKDVLDLTTGSVVILEKAAGSSVDLLVNNKLYARGEVVVIDENFGVRITDILSPEERISELDK